MTPEEARSLFAYDVWANDALLEAVSSLPEEELLRERPSSHGSLLGTLIHIMGAEEVWLGRWTGKTVSLPSPENVPSLEALKSRWLRVREERKSFVDGSDEAKLAEELEVTTPAGDTYRNTFAEMFRHLTNHSSYHRGQVVSMLRESGVRPPSTDLIRFYRVTRSE